MKSRTGLLILSVTMLVLSASACGKKAPLEQTENSAQPESSATPEILSTTDFGHQNALRQLLQQTITH